MSKIKLYSLIGLAFVGAILLFIWMLAPEPSNTQSTKINKEIFVQNSDSSRKQSDVTPKQETTADSSRKQQVVSQKKEPKKKPQQPAPKSTVANDQWRILTDNTMRQSIEAVFQKRIVKGWIDDISCKQDTCVATVKLENHNDLSLASHRLVRELESHAWNSETYVNVNSMKRNGELGELKIEVVRFPQ